MKHLLRWKLILPLLLLLIVARAVIGPLIGHFVSVYAEGALVAQDKALAQSILNNRSIVLAKSHAGGRTDMLYCSGKVDHATAYCNILELAGGQEAARSSYYDPSVGRAGPGGFTPVQPLLLQIMLAVATSGHRVGVGEIAGGVHNAHPAHYSGRAVDFSALDGQQLKGRDQPSLELIQIILPLLPPGSGVGQSQCGQTPPQLAQAFQSHGILTFPDSCGHVHIQVPLLESTIK